jgi:plasmid stabilization system protein ParE
MTLRVVFRPAAKAEFDDAAMRYEERRSGLGVQFVSEVDRAVELARKDPEKFPVKHAEIRCVRVRRFPYSVFYRDEQQQIVVLAVFHARRDPAIWQART